LGLINQVIIVETVLFPIVIMKRIVMKVHVLLFKKTCVTIIQGVKIPRLVGRSHTSY